jgi:hypothetical protein
MEIFFEAIIFEAAQLLARNISRDINAELAKKLATAAVASSATTGAPVDHGHHHPRERHQAAEGPPVQAVEVFAYRYIFTDLLYNNL